jgi:hypothetical protein
MRAFLLIGAGVLTLISATGCSTLTVVRDLNEQRFTSDEEPVAHLSARVGGVYLLYYLPLVTGDARKPDSIRFFHDEQDVERVVHMVTRKSQELGATRLTDLYSWSDSTWSIWTLILWYRWTSVSANASTISQNPIQASWDSSR